LARLIRAVPPLRDGVQPILSGAGLARVLPLGLALGAGAFISMIAAPVFGALSDRIRLPGGRRKPWIVIGSVGNAIGLVGLAYLIQPGHPESVVRWAVVFLFVELFNNIATGPYSALIPDLVPAEQRGSASGWLGLMTMLGTFGGGIAFFNKKNRWKIYNSRNSGLPNDWIYSIAQDKNSNYWIGTYSEGLVFFDGKKWTSYNKYNSILPTNKVTSIYIDRNDNKIIATAKELMFIQNGNWKTQKEMKIDSDEDAIYWISAYNEDTLLMCYKFGSLVIYDGKNFKRFNKSNSSIPLEGYYSICSDKNKIIWAGSFVEGVVRFDGKQFVLLNKDNSGLKGNMIFSIFVDTKNNKWFSTFKNGICIFNEEGVRLN